MVRPKETRVPVWLVAFFALVLLLVTVGPASASGPDGRIRGFVTDSVSGTPIAGASVRLEASDFPWVFQAAADSSGYFDLAVPPHRYGLTVSDPAHLRNVSSIAVGSSQTVWANTTLTAASSRSARLQGYVTDRVSGSPVRVGRVVARPPWYAGTGSYENASGLNASGYFSIDLVPSSYEIATDGTIGYATYTYYPVSIGSGQVLWYNISVDPAPIDAWINGTVYDQTTSAPIPGARITARVGGLLLPPATSNASGSYAIQVPNGSVELAADAAGHAPASTSVYIYGAGSYVQDLYLVALSLSSQGYLLDGVTKLPMAGVLVTISPLFFTGYTDQTVTNASGYYQVAVPDDYYVVSARQPGYAPWSAWIIFFAGNTAWANGTLWPIVSRISGYLVDGATGGPVPGLLVSAIDVRTSYQVSTTADAAGFFSFAVPPSPAMSVWAYGQGPYAGNVAYVGTRPYATTWVNITIERLTAHILANVTDALTGVPISGASVFAAWFYGTAFSSTDANGSVALDAPVSLDVYVNAVASGYQFWTGLLTPVVGNNTLAIALWPDLPTDVQIRGYVRDASSGLGVWPATVEATGYDGVTSNAYTNSTGYYDLSTVAAPQTVRARETGFAGSEVSVNPVSGDSLWVNLTLTQDANAPLVRSFTATPSTGLDPTHPAALVADVNETSLERADLSILMMQSSLAGVGTFLRLGPLDPAGVSVTTPSLGSYAVSASWDTRTAVGRFSDGLSSSWWPLLSAGVPFLEGVNGYWNDGSLGSPLAGSAIFDTRDGRLLYVITSSGFIGPQDAPTSTFAPFASGVRINLSTAAVVGYSLVTGPAFVLGSLHVAMYDSVPSGQYAALLELRDYAGGYTSAAVLMQTAADTTPPVALAGLDITVNEDVAVTLDGSASTDNVGITNYTWTFVDGSSWSLYGVAPTYTFATPGTYVVTLTVRDANGNTGTDAMIVTVRDVTNPTMTVSSPSEAATLSGSLTVTADATDNVGVVRVELFVDGVTFANDTTAPFGFALGASSLAIGNHTLEVVAYDAAGNTASVVRHVTVIASSGGGLPSSDVLFLSGIVLLPIIAALAAVFFLMRRRRPRRPAAVPGDVRGPTGPTQAAVDDQGSMGPPEVPETKPPETGSQVP